MRVLISMGIALIMSAMVGCYESRPFDPSLAADGGAPPVLVGVPTIPPGLDLDAGCEQACQRIALCIGSPEIDECTQECVAQYTIDEIGCEEIVLQALVCIAEIDCEEGPDLAGPCGDAINLAALQCSNTSTPEGGGPGPFF